MDLQEQKCFEKLTGNAPLSWQRRLYDEHFAKGELPRVIDLPTGLGKTMVMAIWLIARAKHPNKVPTRLIYVVDRRTVVDQATDLAERLRDKFGKGNLAVSTLRGQLADNREWSRDPSKPAIIIGTVDLIGSALLFSGYRSGYKRRPLEAGLLGQDSLLVLDEAHLSKPFEKLICAINDTGRFQKARNDIAHGKPMRVIRMSATSGNSTALRPFTLQFNAAGSLTGEDAKDEIITQRFSAKKRLTITTLGEKDDIKQKLAEAAIKLAQRSDLAGKRITVFVRSPHDAMKIADAIRKHGSTKTKPGSYAESVEILTGTMRGLERDKLVDKPVFKERWLNGYLKPDHPKNQSPVFLISTSAGEVGFDLNGDHLVGDEAPLDSWIQRLGRVNRRGNGDATVILVKEKEPADKSKFNEACIATSKLFTDRMDISPEGGRDVSPKALAAFKRKLTPAEIDKASSPKPPMVELTDILLDAWSMTSIVGPMPGRPQVAPWIRGIDDQQAQTTITWRAELDLPGFDQLDLEDIEEWFDTHRILTHETLSVPTSAAAKWFTDRWDKLDDKQKSEVGSRPIVVNRAGLKLVTVNEVINQLGRSNTDSIRNADLILPASFGGIERGKGLLDADTPEVPKDESQQSAEDRAKALASRQAAPDVADERRRYRELVIKTEEGEPEIRPIGPGSKPLNPVRFAMELESDEDTRVQLISYVSKREKLELGSKPQSLKEHVRLVRCWVNRILGQLSFEVDEVVKRAAQLAADYHDHGKARERWQRLLDFPRGYIKPDEPMGKSGGEMKRDSRGYRHEFGSLREFIDTHKEAKFTDSTGQDITKEVIDLALHLIAVHHGRGRPHFPKGGFDPDCEPRSDEIHTDSIRRFARLQRKYGWWHLAWLENLLRCADALASADQDAEDDADTEGDAA